MKKMRITIYKIIKDEKMFNTFMYLINSDYKVDEALNFIDSIINF